MFEKICLTNKMKQYKTRKGRKHNQIQLKDTNAKSNKNKILSHKMKKYSISFDYI